MCHWKKWLHFRARSKLFTQLLYFLKSTSTDKLTHTCYYVAFHQLRESISPAIPELNEDEVNIISISVDKSCRVYIFNNANYMEIRMLLQVRQLFCVFDDDKDGRIMKDEFLSCLRKNPLLIALFAPCLYHKDLSTNGNTTQEEIM